jgi:DEAD/DEAH box helicase domain-containing protein
MGLYHRKYNVIDVETLRLDTEVGGWEPPSLRQMGVAVAVMQSFDEPGQEQVEEKIYTDPYGTNHEGYRTIMLMPHFGEIATEKGILIGHNIKKFDMEVIWGHLATMSMVNTAAANEYPCPLIKLMNIADTMEGFPHRVSLAKLGWENTGLAKSGSGALAPINWRERKYQEVIDYCRNDVKITRLIYERYLKTGCVLFNGREWKVNWIK